MTWDAGGPWTPPAGRPPPEGECHLWVARIDEDDAPWRGLLDARGISRLRAVQVEADRRTLTASWSLQRLVGAYYLATDPGQVTVRRVCAHCGSDSHGRPELVDGGTLDFSVSHHGEWIIMAVVGSGRVGVDLECRRPLPDIDDLAAAVLAPDEAAEYGSVRTVDREAWLYRAWVRKEAVVKLTGHGLALEPGHLDVRDVIAVFSCAPGLVPRDPVRLRDLPAPPRYTAALAVTRPIHTVRAHRVTRR